MELASRIHDAADLESAVELCYQQNWTDGLPVVPPTRGAIERILHYMQRDPAEVGMPELKIYVYPQHKSGDYEAAEALKGAQAARDLPQWLEQGVAGSPERESARDT